MSKWLEEPKVTILTFFNMGQPQLVIIVKSKGKEKQKEKSSYHAAIDIEIASRR
jgi:hypothetical protein